MRRTRHRLIATLLVGALVVPALQGCFTVVAAGVTQGVMVAVDRRSVGTQTEDESIEWKASARVSEKFGDKVHVNFTSYNRKVLLSGEVPDEATRVEVDKLTSGVANVEGVYNELVIGPLTSFGNRSNDAYITSKVKSRSIDVGKFNPVHVKVVTEAGTAFLLGLVTQAEADSAVQVARTTAGVKKVVNLLEIITPAKARELDKTQQAEEKKNDAKAP
jgi:osmotically-inducible protein OsmY